LDGEKGGQLVQEKGEWLAGKRAVQHTAQAEFMAGQVKKKTHNLITRRRQVSLLLGCAPVSFVGSDNGAGLWLDQYFVRSSSK
jgi:hypothetical protein